MNGSGRGRKPIALQLSGNEIHIWTVKTKAPLPVVAALKHVLTASEAERAARFRFRSLEDSYIVVHGALRYVLGGYLDVDPAAVQFVYGPKGKPELAFPSQFNLSHSGDLAVIGLTAHCEIGIDLEQIRPLSDIEQIANRFFQREEAAEILSLPQTEREHAFFCCWTRKEAYIKAIGDGLSAPLDGFRVTVQPSEPVRIIHVNNDAAAADDWSLHDVLIASDYAAAVAYRDRPRPLSLYSVPELADYPGRS
jgi:4'-phosphopantetheinyl transferase